MAGPGSVVSSLFIMMNKKTYILLRIEFLVVTVTFLFLAMSIMDIFRRRFHSPIIMSIFNILDTVSDSIVVYILGAMKTARIKNQLFPVWAIVLVNFRNSIDFISGYGVPDRRGRRFTEWRIVIKLLGVGFLNGSSDSKFLLPLWSLWSVQVLRSFYRFQTHNLAVQSMWHGHSSSLISEYMRTDREPGNFRDADCDPQTMQGYKYLVYGETKRSVTLKKPQYVLRIDPCKQQRRRRRNTSIDTLTTLDKIWQSDGHLLQRHNDSSSQGDDLKDLSLAFALYRLLRCKLEDVTLHEDAIRVNQKLIRARIAEEENDMRTFRVMELQLAFLNDYFNTRYPMVFWCGLPSLFISLALSVVTFAVVCWLSVDIRRVIKPPEGDTTHHVHGFNVDVSITWAFMFFMMFKEIWEIVNYLLSDWTRLLLTCLYQRCKSKCVRNRFAEGIILSFFKSKIINERWHGVIDQYVFLQSYDGKPRFWNLLHTLTVGMVEKKDEGVELGEAISIPDCLKPVILDKLRSLHLLKAYLAKAIKSLPEKGQREKYRWACFELPTSSHIILVWHIATSLCEIELAKGNGVDLTKPGFLCNLLSCFTTCCSSKSYLMDENKLSGKLQESYIIANSLSRYCAYLLVSKPEMIPDSFLVPKIVLQETIKYARDQLLKDHDSLQSKYDKLIEQAQNADKVMERRIFCNKVPFWETSSSVPSEEDRWVILSEVWAELLVHLAPSWNAAAHKKSLESGGEFITHIWALLWHCGIEKSKLWPVEDVPDENNAPGARTARDDNTESGSDQTKQEMQQADAKIGIKEEADTSRSDLMQGSAGAQVQNGKVENGVHGKDGINVECADVDGTWIDHQTEEHSDQEDTEEQKQMVVVDQTRMQKMQSLLALGNMRVSMLEPDALPLKGSLGQELKNLFMETTYGNNDASIPLVPENLFNIMCSRNSKFQRGVTEDSNIMLISLLDGLNDEEPGMVESLFYGQVGKNLRCKACGHATYKDGEKLDLSLAIPSKKPVSVEDCLDFNARENIRGWRCTDCFSAAGNASTNQTEQSDSGTHLKAQPSYPPDEKQISAPDNNEDEHQVEQTQKVEKKICSQITKAPPVLIIQLKRFNYDPRAPHDKTQKLGEPVIFEETLDITKFMHPWHTENEDYKYHLVAVIVRGTNIGWRTLYYLSESEQDWVSAAEEVLGSQAYILFYERLKQPNVNTSLETQLIDHSSEEQ
ncbi:unnamed protein product [Miscanthus lutarioriparius]|uniref:USP domain-containing protein n=1 Tax=Miscanthus lutarioriparius TaxID=422564 RepID=A0A811QFC6_9POAL|nr:unnamed protein product [Miscanthus lutarioriparius]